MSIFRSSSVACELLYKPKKKYDYCIATGDEKFVHYDNTKRKKYLLFFPTSHQHYGMNLCFVFSGTIAAKVLATTTCSGHMAGHITCPSERLIKPEMAG